MKNSSGGLGEVTVVYLTYLVLTFQGGLNLGATVIKVSMGPNLAYFTVYRSQNIIVLRLMVEAEPHFVGRGE